MIICTFFNKLKIALKRHSQRIVLAHWYGMLQWMVNKIVKFLVADPEGIRGVLLSASLCVVLNKVG